MHHSRLLGNSDICETSHPSGYDSGIWEFVNVFSAALFTALSFSCILANIVSSTPEYSRRLCLGFLTKIFNFSSPLWLPHASPLHLSWFYYPNITLRWLQVGIHFLMQFSPDSYTSSSLGPNIFLWTLLNFLIPWLPLVVKLLDQVRCRKYSCNALEQFWVS